MCEGDGVLSLPALGCEIRLADVYADLELLDEAEAAESPAPPSAVTTM